MNNSKKILDFLKKIKPLKVPNNISITSRTSNNLSYKSGPDKYPNFMQDYQICSEMS